MSDVIWSSLAELHATSSLPALLSIAEVAECADVSDKTVRRWIKAGTLPAHRIGPRFLRIERDSVLALSGRAS